MKRRLTLKTTESQDKDPPRLNKSKFDEQIILSPVEGPEETPSSRRHLRRLTAVDARMSSIRESDEPVDFPSGEIATRPCDP